MKVGFFGKLPSYGDFVQRNVSPELIDYWDNWVIQSMDTSRSQLKEQWRDIYFTSPVWRFTLQAGIVSNATIAGLMMPSVDSAGRDYPFFVFCELPESQNPLVVSAELDRFHQQSEDFVISLLSLPRPDLDEIKQQLIACYTKYRPTQGYKQEEGADDTCTTLLRISDVGELDCSLGHLQFTGVLLAKMNTPLSIWTHAIGEDLAAEQRYYKGMPPIDAFQSLLLCE